ncbi:variable surface protein [Plasmodium gonderi]|uniref:Variable surface protein n=1 Tax=Plasmodium gonderi TaxID=77519 RepID=A0A1Y1JN68_PLAGO|nr:variable surface protein [Plasmodium gonderi]GAW83929.1 variable surface protein [Plasmodium gonderi]
MIKDIYKIAKEFLQYEKIMGVAKISDSYHNKVNFNDITMDKFPYFGDNVQNICKYFDNYTSAVVQDTANSIKFSCMYLYYWLYYYNNEKRNTEKVNELYKALISADSTSHNTLCPQSDYTTITEDVMLKLKDLHNMYTKINYIQNNSSPQSENKCNDANECAKLYMKYKVSCESNSYPDFCYELINVRETYNALSTTNCFDQLTHKMLPLFQKNNIRVPIVITIVVILLISITLFILHKLTPYNPCFQGILKRKQNKWNNVDEDYNMFQSYKNVNNAPMKSRHHIFYYKV